MPEQEELKLVRIDRATWRRGGNCGPHRGVNKKYGRSVLCNPQGMMCCLGFDCNQTCDIELDEMIDLQYPSNLDRLLEGLSEHNEIYPDRISNTEFAANAASINDDAKLSDENREKRLIELAAKHDRKYEFYGETPEDYWTTKEEANVEAQ